MKLEDFKNKLKGNPREIKFSETMAVIDANYEFKPKAFKNGELLNAAGENSGSCKLFAFAQKQNLGK